MLDRSRCRRGLDASAFRERRHLLRGEPGRSAAVDRRAISRGRQSGRNLAPRHGTREAAEYQHEGDFMRVTLRVGPQELVFVVFGNAMDAHCRRLPQPLRRALAVIEGPWQVTFPPKLGAPERIELADLRSLTEHPDSGVKYFSGTATYSKAFSAPAAWFADNESLQLDLGGVYDLAEVAQRRAAGHRLEATLPIRRHPGPQARRKPARDPRHQRVDEPHERGCGARREPPRPGSPSPDVFSSASIVATSFRPPDWSGR